MKIMDEANYIVVLGWQVTKLHLVGDELLVYACIWGFSQDGIHSFSGDMEYLAEWIGGTTKDAKKVLQSLLSKGLIVEKDGRYKALR